MLQVLGDWLRHLQLVRAYHAASCVIGMATDAVRDCHRPDEAAVMDEIARVGILARADCIQQTKLAEYPGSFATLVPAENWKLYCGPVSVCPCVHSCTDMPEL